MIFPQPIPHTLPIANRSRLQRPSHMQAEVNEALAPVFAVAPVYPPYPPQSRPFMTRSFSAQLLELGLRYGIDEMIPGQQENRPAFFAEDAMHRYEQAEGNFAAAHTPSYYARFAA